MIQLLSDIKSKDSNQTISHWSLMKINCTYSQPLDGHWGAKMKSGKQKWIPRDKHGLVLWEQPRNLGIMVGMPCWKDIS